MADPYPSLSTDQIAAFVELARQGSLRKAADLLLITEQGLRNRLRSLEGRLKTELYRKTRGPRRTSLLTPQGRRFFPHAAAFLNRAQELTQLFSTVEERQVIHLAATGELLQYVLIEAVRRFRETHPLIEIRLNQRSADDLERAILDDLELQLGFGPAWAATAASEFAPLFPLEWNLATPPAHPLVRKRRLTLADLAEQPLILPASGSVGLEPILEAFREAEVVPRIEMEATSPEVMLKMVDAGLGLAILPLLPDGSMTRGRKVGVKPLGRPFRPVFAGLITRRGEEPMGAVQEFLSFLATELPRKR